MPAEFDVSTIFTALGAGGVAGSVAALFLKVMLATLIKTLEKFDGRLDEHDVKHQQAELALEELKSDVRVLDERKLDKDSFYRPQQGIQVPTA